MTTKEDINTQHNTPEKYSEQKPQVCQVGLGCAVLSGDGTSGSVKQQKGFDPTAVGDVYRV